MIPVAYKDFRISSPFGAHDGLDFAVPIGTVVVHVGAGVVELVKTITTKRDPNGSYGQYVVVRGDDGNKYYYAHLSGFLVRPGQRVNAGTPIGRSGESGKASGPHLHFEIRDAQGRQVDPTPLLSDGELPKGAGLPKGYIVPSEPALRAVAPRAQDWAQFDPAGMQDAVNDLLGAKGNIIPTLQLSMRRLSETFQEAQDVLLPPEEVDEYGI